MMAWLLLVVPVGALTMRRELQAYAFDWAVQAGGSGSDYGRAIAPGDSWPSRGPCARFGREQLEPKIAINDP